MEQLTLGSPIPFPVKQQYTDGQSRGPFIGPLQIASLPRQAAPTYILPCNVVVKGVPRSSTERWYWTVSVQGVLQPQAACKSVMHFPCHIQLTDPGFFLLEGGGGGYLIARFANSRGSKHWCVHNVGGGGRGTPLCALGQPLFVWCSPRGSSTKIFFQRRGLRCAPTSPSSVLGTGRGSTWTLRTLPTATAVIAARGAIGVSLAASAAGTTIVCTSN